MQNTNALLVAVGLYAYMHWLLANGKVPVSLIPLAQKLEMKELTAALALL